MGVVTYDLEQLAKQAMLERGLEPTFSPEVTKQIEAISEPAKPSQDSTDLRKLLWCSIDNDDSRDLDQLTFAEQATDGTTTIWIAVADVDALVPKDSAVDQHAQTNTTSVYTPAKIFPMLPEKLSTDLTSLNEHQDRAAIVNKIRISDEGIILEASIFPAVVHNYAKLAYPSIGAWLADTGPMPEKIKSVTGLEEALKLQSQVAQILKKRRHDLGALTLQSSRAEAKIIGDQIQLESQTINYASELIEHFMISANNAMANHFKKEKIPSLRRVVKVPKNWDRIVEIARQLGAKLPKEPDSKALDLFLIERRRVDPQTFPDLSLTVIKLLGSGEYIIESPGDSPEGHFGLALSEYTHSTAPNRRFPDLISQRQFKRHHDGKPDPYTPAELEMLATHCTEQEDAAKKVERRMVKSAAALLLSSQIGSVYDGIITGASPKGTWVRVFHPPVEGKVIAGFQNLDIGDRVTVKLLHVDVPKGFIDFTTVKT